MENTLLVPTTVWYIPKRNGTMELLPVSNVDVDYDYNGLENDVDGSNNRG